MKQIIIVLLAVFTTSAVSAQNSLEFTIRGAAAGDTFLFDRQFVRLDSSNTFRHEFSNDSARIIHFIYSVKESRTLGDHFFLYLPARSRVKIAFEASRPLASFTIEGIRKPLRTILYDYNRRVVRDFDSILRMSNNAFKDYLIRTTPEVAATLAPLERTDRPAYEELVDRLALHRYQAALMRSDRDSANRALLESCFQDFTLNNPRYLKLPFEFYECAWDAIRSFASYDGTQDYLESCLHYVESVFTNESIERFLKPRVIMNAIQTTDPSILKAQVDAYAAKFGETDAEALQMRKFIAERCKYYPGDEAPDLNYTDLNGDTVRLSQCRGRYVLVYFWTTWCGPCRREAPHWEELVKRYAGRNIEFVVISCDERRDVWVNYMAEHKKGGRQWHIDGEGDPYRIYHTFGIGGVPYFTLIDPSGKFIRVAAPRPSAPALTRILESLPL